MEHPCIGCINNWSGEPVPCANVCMDLEKWKSLIEDTASVSWISPE